MALINSSSNPAIEAEVDAGSKGLRAGLYEPSGAAAVALDGAQPALVAGAAMLGLNDRSLLAVRTDRLGNLASALHTPLLHEPFEGATVHATRWDVVASTMAASQSSVAGLVVNSGNITTANTGYMLRSTARYMKAQRSPMQAKWRGRLARVANSVMEIGFGDAATFNGGHTTGAYWQVTASGIVQPVLTYNSIESSAGAVDISSLLDPARYYTFDVIMDDDEAIFVAQDTSTGLIISRQSLKLPLTAQRLLSTTAVPAMMRLYNSGTAPATAPNMFVTDFYIAAFDANRNVPWPHVMASIGRSAVENPFTGAALANFANNTAPANATLSNTAAGYTNLGGNFSFVTVASAATDYCLFGFQVPVGANLKVTGIVIEAFNAGAAIATTPVTMQWFASQNQPAVTLTSNSFRASLGIQSLAVGAATGADAKRISNGYTTPLVTNSGRFFVIGLRVPVATAGQTIQGFVNVEGYWD